jgi:hypothetical protein
MPSPSYLLGLERIHQVEDNLIDFINQRPESTTVVEIQERFKKLMQDARPGFSHKSTTLSKELQAPTLKSNNPFLPTKKEDSRGQSFSSQSPSPPESSDPNFSHSEHEKREIPSKKWYQEYQVRSEGTAAKMSDLLDFTKIGWPPLDSDGWRAISPGATTINVEDTSGAPDQRFQDGINVDGKIFPLVIARDRPNPISAHRAEIDVPIRGSTVRSSASSYYFVDSRDAPKSLCDYLNRESRQSLSSGSPSWCQVPLVEALPSPNAIMPPLDSSSSVSGVDTTISQINTPISRLCAPSDIAQNLCPVNKGKSGSRAAFTSHQSSPRASQSSSLTLGANPNNRRHSSNENNEDGEDKRRQSRLNATNLSNGNDRLRLGCPYYLRSPRRHHANRSCGGPGWHGIHRLK